MVRIVVSFHLQSVDMFSSDVISADTVAAQCLLMTRHNFAGLS